MVFVTLALLGAFGADQGLLTYFADLSGPGLPYVSFKSFANGQADLKSLKCDGLQPNIAFNFDNI